MKTKPATQAYMGIVDSHGAVQAEGMAEEKLLSKIHYSKSNGWRYKPSNNTVSFWLKPPEDIVDAVLGWLAKKGINAQVVVLIPTGAHQPTPKIITGD